MISAGIECGAKNTKTVILKDGQIIAKASALTGFDQEKAVKDSLSAALKKAGISRDEIEKIGGTGSGKESIKMADAKVNDINAIAKAANYLFPSAGTVVDIGAEETRAARIDEKGDATDFAVNEKCAAGAGGFIEAMGRALEIPIEDMGTLALESDHEITLSAQCVIFAESEVVALIHAKKEKKEISKAIHDSIAGRVVSMARRIGVNKDIVIMGGVGKNVGFLAAMRKQLKADQIHAPEDPEYGAALGAALVVSEIQDNQSTTRLDKKIQKWRVENKSSGDGPNPVGKIST